MPIYEYQCSDCGKTFEIFQKISDEPLTQCKVCNGRLNKLISNCAFHLKGDGWYVTDYKKPVDSAGGGGKNGSSKHVQKQESTPEVAAAGTTETKSESTSTSLTGGDA